MRAVLVLYFKYFLSWDDDLATSIYHTFVALCYLTPILGAIVADTWLGKFKTIVYLSIVYTIGQAVLSVSSIHDLTDSDRDGIPNQIHVHVILSMLGLILIAFGTGGIKPCVAAFGGDQFEDHQEKQRNRFFSIFYLSINAGSLLSTIITPILRGEECGIYTKQKCYPLAFGVPAALMAIALIVFIAGSTMYKRAEPRGNILVQVSRCIAFSIGNRFKHRSKEFPKREHWLDWASEKYGKQLIAQTKMVLKVLFLYIPLPMFWALFDQQGSRWTLQATTMDGDFGPVQIKPDQMQTVNPILIVIMVPVVDAVIYPLIKKCHINFTPLRKMTVGMFLAAVAFVIAALVQIQIDKTLPNFPGAGESQIKIINLGNANATVHFNTGTSFSVKNLASTGYTTFETAQLKDINVTYGNETWSNKFTHMEKERRTLEITNRGHIIADLLVDDVTAKPEQGMNKIRFINNLNTTINITMDGVEFGEVMYFAATNYTSFERGAKDIVVDTGLQNCTAKSRVFGYGSAYTLVVETCNSNGMTLTYIEDIQPNSFSMAWQIPQYFVITCAEVVFSVTGLSFSYSQAPANMKSVLQAGWLLTVAVGNIIVLIIAGASKLNEPWEEYILFAALLVAVTVVFAIMAYFYTYVDPAEVEAKLVEEEKKEKQPPVWGNGTGPVAQTRM
ncbi:solute carrier family 15 member 1 isoform X2 [Hemicordylus capensis]|nr:solute carrier family 15 member 1 isoform X2 [Hemicordylus capensis]XP_053167081.1 solute carrier family 15 member 1 isoform X2 [Hemicordylus capensis]XP_053167082.1 solute carrier family 15 member 1 isoform X2 [Hemicordylus capensis]XP_053167083.1 solute carrier family 15 member 1 isoform X2 [Hemicordylus capensis]XP_053167084.1 solute carrier family 15 member 1 isoform X2 [Hemicordylus capensis]